MIKTEKQIEERLKKKLEKLKKEESIGFFPIIRAVLTGEVQTLEWVLGRGKRGGRFKT